MQEPKKIKGISGSTLKIIAMVCMLIDHIGVVFLEERMWEAAADITSGSPNEILGLGSTGYMIIAYQLMRTIGRLAFPVFCFLLVEGFQKTSDRRKYAMRLGLFALLSEIPFDLAVSGKAVNWSSQNVFFTLLTGFLLMQFVSLFEEKIKHVFLRGLACIITFLAAMLLAEALRVDYGAYGIIAIALLYFFRFGKVIQIIAGCIAFLWERAAPLAFIPIAFYNGKRGISLKYVFYLFYPLHLLILYLAERFV